MTLKGWGQGSWGTSPWGYGGYLSPVIIPLNPVDGDIAVALSQPLSIRVIDDVGIYIGSIRVTVNGLDLVLGGTPVNGATLTKTANSDNGYDLVVTPPYPFGLGTLQTVIVMVEDTSGETAELTYRFHAGVGLRLLQARNPMEGVIQASFNRSMKLDDSFYFPGNWKVTGVSADAADIEIYEVTANVRQPDIANLRYRGGGSTYLLTVYSLLSLSGESMEHGHNTAEFELVYGEEEAPTIRLFDSVYGPLGISQQLRKRRVMDEHTADRSIALALDEQFRLRLQQLDGTIGRTGKPGIRRT